MASARKHHTLNWSALLAMLGFDMTKDRPVFKLWREWLEYITGKTFVRPTPRARATRGWHQKPARLGTINYAKAIPRGMRRGDVKAEVRRCLARSIA